MTDVQLLGALDGPADEIGQVLAVLRAYGIEQPETVTAGVGDRILLDLLEAVSGPLEITVTCRACGEVNTLTIGAGTAPSAVPRSLWLGPHAGLRQPTYGDLCDLPSDSEAAVTMLLARCTVGRPEVAPTEADYARIDDTLAGPLQYSCVGCGARGEVDVDLERAALARLMRAAAALDVEIHLIARTYRWDLATIEALPDARRRRFARLVEDGR